MYVYLDSEPGLYTVGFYAPDGRWIAESDHDSREGAAARVHELNGGSNGVLLAGLLAFVECAKEAYDHWQNDRDHKAGKLLGAMAGYGRGYRASLDAAHAAIAKTKGE